MREGKMEFHPDLVAKVKDLETDLQDKTDDEKEETPSQTILKSMFTKESNKDKSELNVMEVFNFSLLKLLADDWNLDIVDEFINNFLDFRKSLHRKGRTEGFGVVQAETEAKLSSTKPTISLLGGKLPSL